MKIIAHINNIKFLVEVGPNRGRVLNMRSRKLLPEFNIHSILAQGYWEEYTGSQDILPTLLAQVVEVDAPEPRRGIAPEGRRTEDEIQHWLDQAGFRRDRSPEDDETSSST